MQAAQHKRSVPHAAQTQDVYWKILDPEWKPKKRSTRPIIEYQDDDEWTINVADRMAPKPKRKKTGRDGSPAPWDDVESQSSVEQNKSNNSGSKSGSSKDSSSSSSSSSSTSSDTSRSDGSKPEAPPQAKRKAKAKSSGDNTGGRMTDTRVPFGACWLTPRYKNGEVASWFMLCTNPDHSEAGIRCTKECSIKKAGDSSRAVRLLKSWIVFAAESTQSKPDHFACWSDIIKLDDLASDADLEAMAPTDWNAPLNIAGSGVRSLCGDQGIPSQRVPKKRGHSEQVPNAVHEAAQEMWRTGELPETTPEQRKRNRMCSGTNYGTPERYTQLLRYGYIGPNAAPPSGHHWVCRPGSWILLPKGG